MLKINVFNRQGDSVGSVDVDPAEFGGKVNKQLLHDVVLMYLANQRAGTHSTLRRGEVAGSTKKLFRQKGTGNARVGTRRTAKRRGGGTADPDTGYDFVGITMHLSLAALSVIRYIRNNACWISWIARFGSISPPDGSS